MGFSFFQALNNLTDKNENIKILDSEKSKLLLMDPLVQFHFQPHSHKRRFHGHLVSYRLMPHVGGHYYRTLVSLTNLQGHRGNLNLI